MQLRSGISLPLMQENKDRVTDPSQISVSGQEDSSSVFLHSSKLVRWARLCNSNLIDSPEHTFSQRNKLEKLAQWRIDPSLIKFPPESREFSGGFAKVTQGLLASPSRAERGTNKSTDEPLGSDAGKSDKDLQEPGDNHKSKDDKADGHTADGGNDHTNGEERKNNDEEQESIPQISILNIGDGPSASEHIVNQDPELNNRNPQSESDTQEPRDSQQSNDEGTDRHIADSDNDRTKDETRRESDNTNEEHHSDDQPFQPKVGDESASWLRKYDC